MQKSDIFNVTKQKPPKVSVRDSNTFKHSNIFDGQTEQHKVQGVPEILSKSHIFQENNLNININPPPVRNTNTYISCLPIDHSPEKAFKQQKLFDKKKRPESADPYKDNIFIQKNQENVKLQIKNVIQQQIPKPQPRPQTQAQIPQIDPHEKRYKELHAGGVQDKSYEYSQQQSDLRSEQYFHNAQWWNESANPCQVNENAKFSTDYAFERKVQQNQSQCFPQQLKNQQSQQEAHQSKNLMDNKNSQNRKDNHNFSDLFDCPPQVKGQKQKPSGELMPNNLNFNQHDSNLYKKDYGKNSDQAQNNCTQRYFNNLKSDLDNHNYEAEFIKGKKVNPVKIVDILKDENYVPPQKEEKQIKKQENIEPVQNRVSLFRQKQNQQDKDMKVYEFEVKGVSQKFDMKLFKKIANDHGYSVIDFKTNTNKQNTGRATIVVRNYKINADSIDEIQKFLQSQGIIIVKQNVQGVLQSNNMVKNTSKNNQNKNPNKPGSKAPSSKNVEIGSGSNINQEI